MGSSLEYKYSVTQSPPGYYHYVKWWDGGTVLRVEPMKAGKGVEASSGAYRHRSRLFRFFRILGTAV